MPDSTKDDRRGLADRASAAPMSRRAFWRAGTALLAVAAAPALARAQTGAEMPVYTPAVQEPFDASGPVSFEVQQANRTPAASQASLQAVETAMGRYAAIVEAGGWPAVPEVEELRIGSRHAAVEVLRRRLIVTGDLGQFTGRADVFDSYVEQAVRRFQMRNGLNPDGVVRAATLKALNVSAQERLQQLRVNHERIRELLSGLPQRYVAVNIPAAELEAVESDVVVSRHTTIVGMPERETPVLASRIHQINFNPFWHVPESIVVRDIMPRMQKDPSYLESHVIRAYTTYGGDEVPPGAIDWTSQEDVLRYVYRQDPGEDINSMGAIRINFHNRHAVFLHDTPQREMFADNYRAHSSGCVRVQNIEHLIVWMLGTQGTGEDWSRARVEATIRGGERFDVDFKAPIPLYLMYITAWANPDGTVHFRRDLYSRDGVGQLAVTY